jgi:hypothetical protein
MSDIPADTGGKGAAGLSDDELSDSCRLTAEDVASLRDIAAGGRGKMRGAFARLTALKMLARYGHAVPKGESIKPELVKPTVYILERPAEPPAEPVILPVGAEPSRSVEPVTVNQPTDSAD